MERKNRAKSIWENDLRVYLVSLNNNARINLYYRQQNWEDLISSLRKIITTKSKNTFLSQENNKLLLQQRIEWLLWYSLSSQFILEYVLNSLVCFFFFNISDSKIFSRSGPLENGYAERAAAQPLFLTLSYFVFVLLLWSPPENRNTVLGLNQLTWLSLLRGFLNTFLWNWVFSLRCVPMTSDLVEFFLDQFFDHIFSYVFLWKCF